MKFSPCAICNTLDRPRPSGNADGLPVEDGAQTAHRRAARMDRQTGGHTERTRHGPRNARGVEIEDGNADGLPVEGGAQADERTHGAEIGTAQRFARLLVDGLPVDPA